MTNKGTGVRGPVGGDERRWRAHNALLLWVCLSIVFWGLILGGLYVLLKQFQLITFKHAIVPD